MPLFSEFESLYHAMVYYLHDEISDGTKAWRDLSNALDGFGHNQEFLVSEDFQDALLDDSSGQFLHLFEELEGPEGIYYISKIKALPYINFSTLEKSYLRFILCHDKITAFLSNETIDKLRKALGPDGDLPSVFDTYLQQQHKGHIHLDATDSAHLKVLMTAIEKRHKIAYRYMDVEGRVYQGISAPLRLQHDMQSDRLYVIHFPNDYSKPVQGLLRFFSSIEPITSQSYELNAIEALSPYSIKGSSTVTLQIASDSPLLRKALVELSVFERVITRLDSGGKQLYNIQLTYYSFDKEKLMRKIRLLQPELKVIGPDAIKETINQQFSDALRRL